MDIKNGVAMDFSRQERSALNLHPADAEAGIPIEQFAQRVQSQYDKVAGRLDAATQGRTEQINVPQDPVILHEHLTCLEGLGAQVRVHQWLEESAAK